MDYDQTLMHLISDCKDIDRDNDYCFVIMFNHQGYQFLYEVVARFSDRLEMWILEVRFLTKDSAPDYILYKECDDEELFSSWNTICYRLNDMKLKEHDEFDSSSILSSYLKNKLQFEER